MSRRKNILRPGLRAHLSVAADSDLLIKIDAEAARQSRKLGYSVCRSDIVIALLRQGLAATRSAR